jgi:MFS family permease
VIHSKSAVRSKMALGVMMSDAFMMALVFTVLPPVLPIISEHFGGGSQGRFVAQMIMTMPSLGLIAGGLASGWLVDRWGARGVLFAALIAFAVFGSAGLYLDDVTPLLASRFGVGFASTSITTAAAWLLGATYDTETRARLLGYRAALGSVGGVVSLLLAGPVAETAGWRMPFSFYLVSLLIFGVALFCIPGRREAARVVANALGGGSPLALWPLYVLTVAMSVILIASATQLSFLLAEEGIVRPSTQSWVIGTGSAASMAISGFYGTIRLRLGVRNTFVLLMVLMGLGNVAIGFAHSPGVAAFGAAVAGLGSGIALPYLCTLVLDQTTPEIRGRALGLLYSSMFFGDFLNPIVFQGLIPFLGIHGVFVLLGGLVAGSGVLALWTRQPWAREVI